MRNGTVGLPGPWEQESQERAGGPERGGTGQASSVSSRKEHELHLGGGETRALGRVERAPC